MVASVQQRDYIVDVFVTDYSRSEYLYKKESQLLTCALDNNNITNSTRESILSLLKLGYLIKVAFRNEPWTKVASRMKPGQLFRLKNMGLRLYLESVEGNVESAREGVVETKDVEQVSLDRTSEAFRE